MKEVRSCCLPQTVLEFSTPLGRLVEAVNQFLQVSADARDLVRLINSGRALFCGNADISPMRADLVYDLSRRAGIAW